MGARCRLSMKSIPSASSSSMPCTPDASTQGGGSACQSDQLAAELFFPSTQGRAPNLYVNEMHKSTEVSGRGCACRELNVGSAGSFLGIAFIFKQKFLYLQTTQFWICCKAPPQTKQNKEGPGGQESTKQLHHSFLQMQRVAIFETRNGFNYAAL